MSGGEAEVWCNEEVEALIEERYEAKSLKDYDRSNAIAQQFEEAGVVVLKTSEGIKWHWRHERAKPKASRIVHQFDPQPYRQPSHHTSVTNILVYPHP